MWKTESKGAARAEDLVKQFLPPCQIRCPINEDIQRTNVLISLLPDDPAKAKEGVIQIGDYLYEKNPLFNVCGYVCGLCERECNYKTKGGSIRRRLLKRFLSDTYTDYLGKKPAFNLVKNKEKVAIVGGGPGGLLAAFNLSKKGYKVTLFEGSKRLGGAVWLIPSYRLPAKVLQSAVDNLVRIAGVEVKFGAKLGDGGLTIDKLKSDGFKAIFLAQGTPSARVLTFGPDVIPGQDLSGVEYGLNFLSEVSQGKIDKNKYKGKKVIVIGGGNVAFDVARTVKRLGAADVTMQCLECADKCLKDGIPADEEEIKGAEEEGIKIVYSHGVNKIIGENGKFKGIVSPKCTSVFDERGFNPKFDCADCIELKGDILLVTVGQGIDRGLMQKEGLLDDKGRLAVDPLTLQNMKQEQVFIGGDLRRIGFIADAMKDGTVAAESMDRYLRGVDMKAGREKQFEALSIPHRDLYKAESEIHWVTADKRMNFDMFEKGLTLEEAKTEAKRCVTCGPCASCRACVSIGLQVLHPVEENKELCSGCGMCVYVCNYDAARLIPYNGRIASDTDMTKCKSCGMCVVACPANARKLAGDDTEQKIAKVLASL